MSRSISDWPSPPGFSRRWPTASASGDHREQRNVVAWGSFRQFTVYADQLNPWAPAVLISPLAWFVTVAETVLGVALVIGLRTRYAALASGVLLGLFAMGMTVGTGLKSALNYSVLAASAGAFALASERSYRWSLDAMLTSRAKGQGAARAGIQRSKA
jgi:uncharacterized membrane protein YphA (DoxX/SURF4 family)